MVYALWGTLAVVAATGIAMAGPPALRAAHTCTLRWPPNPVGYSVG